MKININWLLDLDKTDKDKCNLSCIDINRNWSTIL